MCGRFKRGKVISVPQGEHLYIGSAMNKKGLLRSLHDLFVMPPEPEKNLHIKFVLG